MHRDEPDRDRIRSHGSVRNAYLILAPDYPTTLIRRSALTTLTDSMKPYTVSQGHSSLWKREGSSFGPLGPPDSSARSPISCISLGPDATRR